MTERQTDIEITPMRALDSLREADVAGTVQHQYDKATSGGTMMLFDNFIAENIGSVENA